MSEWVLIVLLMSSAGGIGGHGTAITVHSVEFRTAAACHAARDAIKTLMPRNASGGVVCIEKK